MKSFQEFTEVVDEEVELDESQSKASQIQDKLDAIKSSKKKDDFDFDDLETKDDKRKKAGGVKNFGKYGTSHDEAFLNFVQFLESKGHEVLAAKMQTMQNLRTPLGPMDHAARRAQMEADRKAAEEKAAKKNKTKE